MVSKILFLAANPIGTNRLRLDEEVREIEEGLRRAQRRQDFELVQKWAVRPQDVRRALLDEAPSIIHFSGHGESAGQVGRNTSGSRDLGPLEDTTNRAGHLIFEDSQGNPKPIEPTALANLFKLFADNLDCVVLNACYSETQAKAIAKFVPYVVGTNKAIGDRAAIEFAIGFYDGLGAGRPVDFAFELGRSAIEMEGLNEALTPVLIKGQVPLKPGDQPPAPSLNPAPEPEHTSANPGSAGVAIPQDRIRLYQFLMDLPDAQFEQVINALRPPRGNVPPFPAPRGQRVPALFDWLESPLVPNGIELLRTKLEEVLNP
jgi:hypothetical protein